MPSCSMAPDRTAKRRKKGLGLTQRSGVATTLADILNRCQQVEVWLQISMRFQCQTSLQFPVGFTPAVRRKSNHNKNKWGNVLQIYQRLCSSLQLPATTDVLIDHVFRLKFTVSHNNNVIHTKLYETVNASRYKAVLQPTSDRSSCLEARKVYVIVRLTVLDWSKVMCLVLQLLIPIFCLSVFAYMSRMCNILLLQVVITCSVSSNLAAFRHE